MRLFVFFIFCLSAVIFTATVPPAYARDASFTWTANTDDIDGYRLYMLAGSGGGISKSNYTEKRDLDLITSYTYQGLADDQTYYFALTAFRNSDSQESGFSTIVTVAPLTAPPADAVVSGDITFDRLETVGYSNQDKEGTVTIEDDGKTLAMTGNRWVKTTQYYEITPDTVIEFDFRSTIEGEVHGIGFDEDNELTNDKRIIQFFGTSIWNSAIQSDQRYLESDMGNWVHFIIPIGGYYSGSNMNLVFVNDHDNPPSNGTGWFSNVRIHEGDAPPPPPPPATTPPPAATVTAVILDNGDPETSFAGDWLTSGGENPFGTSSLYSKTEGGTYKYEAPLNGNYEISLWWTEWPSRCTDVPVKIYNGSGLIDTLTVNQQTDGGKWNLQGSYTFTGTGAVVISSQGEACSTNADAVKIVTSASTPSAAEVIIDNGDSRTAFTGEWQISGGADYYENESVYSKESGATFKYETPLNGQYDLSLWWTEWPSRCTQVPVEIYDNSTLVDTLVINQHENGGKWNLQGRYSFTGTAGIVIKSQGSKCSTNADAVKFSKVN